MMTELMLDTCRMPSMSVLASNRQRYPLHRHVNVAVRQNAKAQDCVTKTIRDPFTIQFTHMPRGVPTLPPHSTTSTPEPAAKSP